jgi:hypothetical protein
VREPATDSLAVLLLPGKLEGMALEAHARDLLSIPRVIALEPSRVRPPRFLRDAISLRQARRLRFPGQPRLLLLYHPAQYPLARALCARYEDLELWYLSPPGRQDRPAAGQPDPREAALDVLARERATQVLPVTEAGVVDDAPLRERLRELDVINPRAFLPGARPARDSGRPRPGHR